MKPAYGTTALPRATGSLAAWLRREPVGGALLVAAAALALLWANSPWSDAYLSLSEAVIGPAALHLDLDVATWAADGLLAIFFFVVGLELKQEFVAGELRRPAQAAVPIAAAVGGMAVPAAIYLLVVGLFSDAPGATGGWAIPMATDIAFALAVLAVVGSFLPGALRTFLLTLAVVDDLIAITVIAVFYTADLAPGPLLLAVVPLAVFTALVQRGVRSWWLLLPLAALTWFLVHESGVHATVAGVLLGFAVPVRRPVSGPPARRAERDGDEVAGMSLHFERRWRPISVGLALPKFAFFAAGVPVGDGLGATLTDPVTLGIVAGLVLGKVVGVSVTVAVMERFTRARLDPSLGPVDVLGVGLLGGIGFTVSLLISELAFVDEVLREHARVGVLTASLVSAVLAVLVLRARDRALRRRSVQPGST